MSSAHGQRERASADSPVAVQLWRICPPLSVHTPDPGWRRVGVSSLGSIHLKQSSGRLLSGWQVDMWGDILSWFQQWMLNTGHHSAPRRTRRNHASPSVASIFICASCTCCFCSSLFPSLLEIITRHVRGPVGGRARRGRGGLSHCLLSFWLSKWHRISSCSCLPLWHYNYP